MTMVDRFTSIIDAFDDTTVGLSLDEVAERAALPRSTTHRILLHLVRLHWLDHSERGYGLGARALSWGAGDLADLRLREAAAPVLHQLHLDTGAVVHLGVLDRGDIVHVDKLGPASAGRVPTRVGSRAPAAQLALGLAALAVRPADTTDPRLTAQLHRIRCSGAVTRRGDYTPGLTGVAAAIDHRSAVGVVLPGAVAPQRFRPVVMAAAARIAAARC